MTRLAWALVLSIALPSAALAQQEGPAPADLAKIKEAILAKVKARLEQEHRKILERVSKIIDEELSGRGPAAKAPETDLEKKIAELEAKLDELDKQKQKLRGEIDKLRRQGVGADEEEQIKGGCPGEGAADDGGGAGALPGGPTRSTGTRNTRARSGRTSTSTTSSRTATWGRRRPTTWPAPIRSWVRRRRPATGWRPASSTASRSSTWCATTRISRTSARRRKYLELMADR